MSSINLQSKSLRNIQIIMGISLVLTLLVIGADASMGTVGSYFTSPAVGGITFVHHVTLLALAGKQRKNNKLATERSVLVRLPTIVCNWLLFIGWIAVVAVASFSIHEQLTRNVFETENWKGLEMLLIMHAGAIVELPVFFTLALLSSLERRKQPAAGSKV